MKSRLTWIALFLTLAIAGVELGWGDAWNHDYLLWEFRIPRVLGALMGGATLALSGVFLQTLFRNPLAGPFLIGISPGATLAMALGLFWAEQQWGWHLGQTEQIALALAGALLALMLQLTLARKHSHPHQLLLVGMVLSFVFGAATDLLQNIASAERLKMFSLWSMGSFERVTPESLPSIAAIFIALWALALLSSTRMDAYLLGDGYAQSGGLSLKKTRYLMIAGGAVGAAWMTAVCGPISFIGLVAPHIARELLPTASHRKLLVHSLIWGAFLASSADFLAHHLLEHQLLQVNAVSALIGGPILLWSLLKKS